MVELKTGIHQVEDECWKLEFEKREAEDILNITQNNDIKDIPLLLEKYIADIGDDKNKQTSVGSFGITCLKLFLQENWTGPPADVENLGNISSLLLSKDKNLDALIELESDGDEIYPLVHYPILLLIANTILLKSVDKLKLFSISSLWSVKCLAAYLSVMEESKYDHYKIFKNLIEKDYFKDTVKALPNAQQAEFHLECSHLYSKFYDFDKSKECLEKVKHLLKIELSLTASLGKRTKFQENFLPQMRLDVNVTGDRDLHNTDIVQTESDSTKDLPTDIVLDEETLLHDIKFIDGEEIRKVDLSPVQQAFAITSCMFLQKSRPQDKLTHEEILPFITTVLSLPQSWSIQHKSLFIRCVTEFSNSRKAERALTQLEALVESYGKKTPVGKERLPYLQAVGTQPKWTTERTYANLLFSIGMLDSALEIFLKLHIWDDVITCYQRLGKHGKAEAVIREEISKRETPMLWNQLGDATFDKEYYEKAWELSKHRNARSQRSIGLWHLRKQEFTECIPYLQKSLELNSLQPGIAFSLGCAYMKEKDLKGATKAFQHSVSLEPDNGEAWNNLASNFIRLNQLPKAYKALQEATRISYDNWKVWENFLLVCTDVGAFEESLNCIHRLVDLKRKELDVEVLVILTLAIINGENDFKGVSSKRLKPKLFKTFGHITSQITHNPSIWELYAKLYLDNEDINDTEKALQFLYKSHRCYTQNTNWEKSSKSVPSVMNVSNQMFEATKKVCQSNDYKARAISLYSTTRMCIDNLIIRLKKAYSNEIDELPNDIQTHINQLQSYREELQNLINSVS